jgi:hypothetical protein
VNETDVYVPCADSACFSVETIGKTVRIVGRYRDNIGVAEDTPQAWAKFRDDIKAGKWDHIGGES